jgi:hypothetical protein
MPRETNIEIRKGSKAAWESTNPVLEPGEPGFETDTKKLKLGDGTTAWNNLPYFRADGGELVDGDGNNADIAFDPNYIGEFIELSNNSCTSSFTSDASENETSVLTNYAIKNSEKVVFSMVTNFGGAISYTGVGIANRQHDVNYENNGGYLGANNNSIGVYDNGSIYFNDKEVVNLDLNFQLDGSVVDVAVDRVNNLMWFRANGGYWNGDNTQNPETATGGIDISAITGDVYPGACPYAYQGVFGQISINNSILSPPAGFKVLVGSQQVPLTGYYYFIDHSQPPYDWDHWSPLNGEWNDLNNWWLNGVSTVAATRLPNSNDNVKIFSQVQTNRGSTPTVQNMFISTLPSVGELGIGIEINVSGIARFYGSTYIQNVSQNVTGFPTIAKINGNCVFYGTDSGPYATISVADAVVNGNATFYGESKNNGTVAGNAIFSESSKNDYNSTAGFPGVVSGEATFEYGATNYGVVNNNATFNDSSINYKTVNGNATFNSASQNSESGVVNGNAIFNQCSRNFGTVTGNVTLNNNDDCD